jgi:hypothetical protein
MIKYLLTGIPAWFKKWISIILKFIETEKELLLLDALESCGVSGKPELVLDAENPGENRNEQLVKTY